MTALLEKTIFKVDVLTLEIRFDAETSGRLRALAQNRSRSAALTDSIVEVALAARNVWARIEFKRGVRFEQFADGIRDNARRARDAGIISAAGFDAIDTNLPRWYGFLAEDAIREGDVMVYRIRGDTLQTLFRRATGEVPLDQADVGSENRLSVLGGYFAPKSDFRKALIASLFDR